MPAVNMRRANLRATAKAELNLDDEAFVLRVAKDPITTGKHIATMTHAELRLFARGIKLPQHNIDDLSEDKLRQNCQMTVASVIEALTGE